MSFRKKSWNHKLSKINGLENVIAAENLRTTEDYINAAKCLIGEIVPTNNKIKFRKQSKPSKIVTALENVPYEPELLENFVSKYGVSANVLKQSKRFVRDMNLNQIGKIFIKKNKETGQYWIYKED